MKRRLVVVSNRVPDGHDSAAGGLAVALHDALRDRGGMWFGWSGRICESADGAAALRTSHEANVTYVTFDLNRDTHDGYYAGYSNGVLWPVLHGRVDLADFDPAHVARYARANELFATSLLPLLRADDLIWVHDYHLLSLGRYLRELGSRQRIGFFLHIPVPAPEVLATIPHHQVLLGSLFDCDLVGLQSKADLQNLRAYLQRELGAQADGPGAMTWHARRLRIGVFPIGIDVHGFQRFLQAAEARETARVLREQYAQRKLLVGVDRLDYSKGIPQRLQAMRTLFLRYPEDRGRATLIQVAVPCRESVRAYRDLTREVERLSGALNGDFGELDWMPLRFLHRAVARRRLPGLFCASKAALVTPLRDGMNLVAKEYVAAQDPQDPGVLILSRFAGAAEQLRSALLVNPYDVEATADAIHQALHMPVDERRARHAELIAVITQRDVRWWWRRFVGALEATPPRIANEMAPLGAGAPRQRRGIRGASVRDIAVERSP